LAGGHEGRAYVFSKVIEINNAIGDRMSGGQVETPRPTGMPVDGVLLYSGGQVVNEYVLDVLEDKRFEGQAASNALALNRMATAPEPSLRRSDRSLSLDERLRRLGIGVADR
jgi:hypothetical protein